MIIVILISIFSSSEGMPVSNNEITIDISEKYPVGDLNLNFDDTFTKKVSKRNAEWSNRQVSQPVLSSQLKPDAQESENIETITRFPKVVRVRLQNGTRARQTRRMNQQNVEKENIEPVGTSDGVQGKIVRVKKFKRKRTTERPTTTVVTSTTIQRSPTPRYTRPAVMTTKRATTQASAYSHITVINKIEKDQKPKRKQKSKNISLWVPSAEFGGRTSQEYSNEESTPPTSRQVTNDQRNRIEYENPSSYRDKEPNQRRNHSQEQRSSVSYQQQNDRKTPYQRGESRFNNFQIAETSTVPGHTQNGLQKDTNRNRETSPQTKNPVEKRPNLEAENIKVVPSTPAPVDRKKPTDSPKILDGTKSFEVLNDDIKNVDTPQNESLLSTSNPILNEFGDPYFGQSRPNFGGYNNQFPYYGDPRYYGPGFNNRDPFFQTNTEFPPLPQYGPYYNRNPQQFPNYYSGPQRYPPYQRPDALGLPQFQPSPHIMSLRRSILDDDDGEESIETTTEFSLPKFEMPPIDFNDKGCRTVYKEVSAVPEFQPNGQTYENKAKSVVMTRECFFPDGVPTVSPPESKTEIDESTISVK